MRKDLEMENRDDQNKNQTGQQGLPTDQQNKQGFGQQGQQGQDSFGQQDKQSAGQQGQSSTGQTGSEKGEFGEAGGDTTLAQGQKSQTDKQPEEETGKDKGFLGTNKEDSSEAYLSEGETAKSDFAEKGQGATENRAGNEDIESGTTPKRDASLDDAS